MRVTVQVEAEEWLDRICVKHDVWGLLGVLMTAMPGWRHCVSANIEVFTPVSRDCVACTWAAGWCEYMRSNRVNLAHIASVFPFLLI